jgi:UDP:flavonoid glycosyltransferase YjiC (YdhE family)
MEKALIVTAPILSHVLPSLFLAELLEDVYDVSYAVPSGRLKELVNSNGYYNYPLETVRFANGFDPIDVYNRNGQKKNIVTAFSIFYSAYKHRTFYRRREELGEILMNLKPDLVVIDVFSASDLLVIKSIDSRIKVVFFNPMLNLIKSQYADVRGKSSSILKYQRRTVYRRILDCLSPLRFLAKASGYDPKSQLDWVYQKYPQLGRYPVRDDYHLVRMFKNTKEIILAPHELEFGQDVCRDHQIYAGFSLARKRVDLGIDLDFGEKFKKVLHLKESGRKLVYCSFGTYFSSQDEHKYVVAFFTLLVHAFRNDDNITFVIASKDTITEAVMAQTRVPNHFFFFKKVPQLTVLDYSDLFITHGGLGSVKEALSKAVPMLVYPLDLNWDQAGNALRIEHHQLGMQGKFGSDGAQEIYSNAMQVLNNPLYANNCQRMKDQILSSSHSYQILQFLNLAQNSAFK